jgi:hypothetical protein
MYFEFFPTGKGSTNVPSEKKRLIEQFPFTSLSNIRQRQRALHGP